MVEPVHGSLVLIAYASSEDSDETAQTRKRANAQSRQSLRCSHTVSGDIDEGSDQYLRF